ncbi:MAG: hypothetical protein ACPGMR_03105 [Pontibacterium sp.]
MAPIQIALLIGFGVGVLVILASIIQQMEDKKKATKMRIMHLRTSIRRCSHLLDNIPSHFMSTELHQVLSRYLEFQCKASLELEDNAAIKKQLDDIQASKKKSYEPEPHPEGSITLFATPHLALRAKAIIKELAQFLNSIKGHGEVSSTVCNRLIDDTKVSYQRADIDYELHEVLAAEPHQSIKMTVGMLRNIFGRLGKVNVDHVVDRQLYEVRSHLHQLVQELDELEEQKKASKDLDEAETSKDNAPPPPLPGIDY